MVTTRRSSQKRQVETRNFSMTPATSNALTALAARAGHGNASRIVQELITREAIYQFGADWADRFAPAEDNEETAA